MADSKKTTKTPGRAIRGHLNFAEGSYLASTSYPLYALLFLLPFIGLYEVGTILINTDELARTSLRIISFTWLVEFAGWLGVERSIVWAFPGMLVVVILFFWHLVGHFSWKIKPGWIGGMALESLFLTLPLFVFSMLIHNTIEIAAHTLASQERYMLVSEGGLQAKIITSIGAGIYEELVFRLILIGLLLVIMEDILKIKRTVAIILAVMVSSVLFSLHHYWCYQNGQWVNLEPLTIASFIYRTGAGIYFAGIFHYRGYGIAAGVHIAYDIIYFTLKALYEG